MSILKRICLAAVATGAICVGVASAQSDSRDEAACRDNPFPSCTKIGEQIVFRTRTGGAGPGNVDPLWSVNGGTATAVNPDGWSANLQAGWITPSAYASGASKTSGAPKGPYTYKANIWMEDDPYFFDKIVMNLIIGADNTIVSVKVNGNPVHAGNGGIYDFQAASFDGLNLSSAVAVKFFHKGCNEIEIETSNEGSPNTSPTGLSVAGNIRAVCSKCTTPRPAAAS